MTTIKRFQAMRPRDQIARLDPGATFTTVIDFRGQQRDVVTVSAAAKTIDMPIIRRIAHQERLLVHTHMTAVRTPPPTPSPETDAATDDSSGPPRRASER